MSIKKEFKGDGLSVQNNFSYIINEKTQKWEKVVYITSQLFSTFVLLI